MGSRLLPETPEKGRRGKPQRREIIPAAKYTGGEYEISKIKL
jgi:hypothetical protein